MDELVAVSIRLQKKLEMEHVLVETLGHALEQAKDENAKLRELVRDMHKAFFALDIDHCQACPRDTINGTCMKFMVGGSDECSFEEEMRELGIEVQ